jgi:hypothetical protein
MIKTQIQMEKWQYEAIKKEGLRTSRSMSDLIREAVSHSLRRAGSLPPLAEAAGKFSPMSTEDLKSHDARWADSIR